MQGLIYAIIGLISIPFVIFYFLDRGDSDEEVACVAFVSFLASMVWPISLTMFGLYYLAKKIKEYKFKEK